MWLLSGTRATAGSDPPTSRRGSAAHDPIHWDADAGDYRRGSDRAGGVEGGISTGEVLWARVAMKPRPRWAPIWRVTALCPT